ncbi:neuronal acetylcholine receptor subunit alpha-10-like [Uloborus diversus]|uniref:neuronal acetylcholine receptor subunit alpha-10-like n=1 Tax=Uloborus diversus TaxID=327109 RepID=UPI0024094C4D|nr:neuronal acetylcholine receptor subunit alpha-10-like [Uloborus diversus]
MFIGFLLMCTIELIGLASTADENEYRLTQHLLTGRYDKNVRPAKHAFEPVNVTFGLALTQIIDVIWIDYGLIWNHSEFGGIKVVRIPADKVWRPDIILYNNADSQYNNALLSTNVIISSDGNLTWLSSAIFRSSCKIDVAWFPFDEQNCSMKFASWTYDGRRVDLVIQTREGDLSNYIENGEWDLITVVVERNEVYYSCCLEPYPDVTFHVVLRRRPLFYVFNLILPCALITGIALLGFYMPSDSGEKVTLGITTLLSMTVFLMVIGESMPPTSDTVPLVGLYYAVVMTLVSLATAMSVVTLNIHHRGLHGNEVPPLVKKFVFGVLAKVLCIKVDFLEAFDTNQKVFHRVPNSKIIPDQNFCENISPIARCGNHCIAHLHRSIKNPVENFETHFLKVLDKVHQTIEKNETRTAELDRRDKIKAEWQLLALVIDRCLLWVFIVSTLGTTFGILSMSPHARLY